LGTRLFLRDQANVRLTDAGLAYRRGARRAAAALSDAERSAQAAAGGVAGTLRISAPPALFPGLLSRIVSDFLKEHPGVMVDMVLTDRMVNPILDNVDLAIRTGTRLADSDLRSRRLADVNLIAVCSPELAEQLLELDVVPSVEFVRQDRTAIDFPSCPVLRSPRLRTNGYLTLVDAIRQGVGMGVVPRSIVARDLAEGRLVQVLPEWKLPTGRVWAVYPSRGQLPQKIRRMLDALADGWKLDELAGGL